MIDSYIQIFVSQWGKYHFWLFIKNDTSVSTKRHVSFNKTTRRFHQNNTSLSTKQHVTFIKTTRHFHQNNTSLSTKQYVTFIKTIRHFQQYYTSVLSLRNMIPRVFFEIFSRNIWRFRKNTLTLHRNLHKERCESRNSSVGRATHS